MASLDQSLSPAEFGPLVGISRRSASELVERGVIENDMTGAEALIAYCSHLREQAAGRSASDGYDLATERAKLARAQRERVEMENATSRGQLIPADQIEPKLRAALIAAREDWRNAPARLAREVAGKAADEIEAILTAAFDAFLVKFSRWPMTASAIGITDEPDE